MSGENHEVVGTRHKSRFQVAILAGSLILAAATANLWIARSFDRLQAFDAVDLFFHADPPTRRFVFAENLPDRIFVKHPNLGNFVNPPLRAIAAVSGTSNPKAFRWELALWVVPIVAGIKTAALFVSLRLLGFSILESVVVAILSAVTFSHLLFTSMPESFGLTGGWIALLLLASAWTLGCRNGPDVRDGLIMGVWLALGIVGVGITLTNLIPFAVVLVCVESLHQPSRLVIVQRVLLACMVALIGNLMILGLFVGPRFDSQKQRNMPVGIRGFIHHSPTDRIVRFPAAVSDAFAPPAPSFLDRPENRTPYYFTLQRALTAESGQGLIVVVVWALLFLGAWGCLRADPQLRLLAIAAITILVFNAGFHAWWGSEYVLYSQHWEPGMMLLLAGLLRFSEPGRRWCLLALVLFTIILAFHNVGVVQGMMNTWANLGPASSPL